MFASVEANLKQRIRRYSTPNGTNTIDLLHLVGYDVKEQWRWQHGPVAIHPAEAVKRLNAWVDVRHAIAHGDRLPSLSVISTTNKSGPSVRLSNAESCLSFIEALALCTRQGAAHIVLPGTKTSSSPSTVRVSLQDEQSTSTGEPHGLAEWITQAMSTATIDSRIRAMTSQYRLRPTTEIGEADSEVDE
jgi:hypothetical protein